jgi:hypothetical protein
MVAATVKVNLDRRRFPLGSSLSTVMSAAVLAMNAK